MSLFYGAPKCLSRHCNRPHYTYSFLENLLLYSRPLLHLGHIEFPLADSVIRVKFTGAACNNTGTWKSVSRSVQVGFPREDSLYLAILSGEFMLIGLCPNPASCARELYNLLYVCVMVAGADCAPHSMNKPESTLPNNHRLSPGCICLRRKIFTASRHFDHVRICT